MTDPYEVFPFNRVLSLVPLIEFWREVAQDASSPRSILAEKILTLLSEAPELEEPITELAVLEKHIELIDLMMTAVFPMARWDKTYAAAFVPFQLTSFYATSAFARLRLIEHLKKQVRVNGQEIDQDVLNLGQAMNAYYLILNTFYGEKIVDEVPLIVTTTDEQTGLKRHFRINIDARFVQVRKTGKPKNLTEEDLQRMMAEPMNLSLWMAMLPPHHFELSGFSIITALDVTVQEVLSLITKDLLQKDAMTSVERIDTLQMRLRMLLHAPELQLGLICLRKNDFNAITGATVIGRSLLMSDNTVPECTMRENSYYARAFESEEPIIVSDLDSCDVCTGFEHHLRSQGVRNLVIAPLRYEGELIGLLELASPNPGAVNPLSALTLKEVFSLFTTAMKRSLEEQEDRVQALVKKHYTAIHPTVEWRFRQAAINYMTRLEQDRRAELEPIVFKNVYPLYGLSDIRGSSTRRNAAIQADLIEQLGMALSIIVEASMHQPLPAFDELAYRLNKYIDEILNGVRSGDETSLFEFLRDNVECLFDHLASLNPSVRQKVEAYRAALDPTLGILYRQRKDFEESVTLINETISEYIDTREEAAQAMFPHYFEKYKTDGVDYNLYVGASLQENGRFDPLYLRNLRLWQLMTTCGVVWRMEDLKSRLKMPLETAHLILVQSTPLSIRFRQDEKKFDVDGAYNIRYEIVKKRIDKAAIRGTRERLTQPGKIAIVYSQLKEAQEYIRYLEYLQAAGYLTGDIEKLDLEDLQGVYGLKALRITVSPEAPHHDRDLEMEIRDLPAHVSGDGATVQPA